MNTYKTSWGEKVTQSQIDALTRTAKEKVLKAQLNEHGYHFCQNCGKNSSNTDIDCSHNVSVDRAKKTGATELCWDVSNIEILCRDCHTKKDGLNLKFSK